MHQRTDKSSFGHPQTQQKGASQFAPRPFGIQAQQETQKPLTQEEIESKAFANNKFEAFGLQMKEKRGTITPVEKERLGVLQAKMNDLLVQRWEKSSKSGFNFANVVIHSQDAKGNAPIQTKLDQKGEQQQSPQESSETASNEGMGNVQRVFGERNPQSHAVSPIQAKLTIGQPGDKYEIEADSVASKVVEQINAPASAQSTQGQSVQRQEEEKEEEVQAKLEISALQRMEEKEEEDIQGKSIQKRGEAIGGGEAATDLDSAINSARGGGQPLDGGMQRSMGQAMGADFSGVRVHTDSQSDQLNQSIQAKAFATGQDVFFRQGEYNPGSRGGQELIAHELTHVVQQNATSESSYHLARSPVVQRLKYKPNSPPFNLTASEVAVDITTLTMGKAFDVLAKLKVAQAKSVDNEDIYRFDAGDEAALHLQIRNRLPIEIGEIKTALATDDVERGNRNSRMTAHNQQNLIDNVLLRATGGTITGFEEWVAEVATKNNALQRQDQINELREAIRQLGLGAASVDVSEKSVPGASGGQTADLTMIGKQVEVKTVQRPIREAGDLSLQIRAGVGKFAGATSDQNEVTVFASYGTDFINGYEVDKGKNIYQITTVDPTNKTVSVRIEDRTTSPVVTKNTINKGTIGEQIIKSPLGQAVSGKDKVLYINIVLENGQSFRLTRTDPNGTAWTEQNI